MVPSWTSEIPSSLRISGAIVEKTVRSMYVIMYAATVRARTTCRACVGRGTDEGAAGEGAAMCDAKSRLLLHELLHRSIHRVRDVNITLGADRDKVGLAEFAHSIAGLSDNG
jgi:hypothetical protein